MPPLPPPTEYFNIDWQIIDGRYCLDNEGAKCFILNKKMSDSREKDLENIIEGQRSLCPK